MTGEKTLRKGMLGVLFTLTLILWLILGRRLSALAYEGNPYTEFLVTTDENKDKSVDDMKSLQVFFNGKPWYIIADDSTTVDEGTVTLLAADSSFGLSKFHDLDNHYSSSTIKRMLDEMTAPGGTFANVADAIETIPSLNTPYYSGHGVFDTASNVRLYLLSEQEVRVLPLGVRAIPRFWWWLRSSGAYSNKAAFVYYEGSIDSQGYNVDYPNFGIRPALKLDLSSVVFSYDSKTFSLENTEPLTDLVAPEAKTLTYTGCAQELVTAGSATGGTLYYAVTNDEDFPADNLYTTSIPKAINAGTYYVWYRAIGDKNHSNSEVGYVEVEIKFGDTPGVLIDVPEFSLQPDAEEQIKATAVRTDTKIKWSSDNSNVAKVDDTGKVTAVSNGTAIITGTITENGQDYSSQIKIKVAELPPEPKPTPTPTPTDVVISLNVSETNLTLGMEQALNATTVPADSSVTWTSSDKSVATVTGSGIVTGLKPGTATITATITVDGKEYSASCKVTVISKDAKVVLPASKSIIPNGDEHTHKFNWETIEASEEDDGELRYQCEICGEIQTRVPLTAYNVFNKTATEKIRKAPKDSTVKIETNKWISFHKMVMEALAERPDVTLEISFLDGGYKGKRCTVTVPKGTDVMSLVDKNGFTGFLYLGGKFGVKTN